MKMTSSVPSAHGSSASQLDKHPMSCEEGEGSSPSVGGVAVSPMKMTSDDSAAHGSSASQLDKYPMSCEEGEGSSPSVGGVAVSCMSHRLNQNCIRHQMVIKHMDKTLPWELRLGSNRRTGSNRLAHLPSDRPTIGGEMPPPLRSPSNDVRPRGHGAEGTWAEGTWGRGDMGRGDMGPRGHGPRGHGAEGTWGRGDMGPRGHGPRGHATHHLRVAHHAPSTFRQERHAR
jgi:hypothetical protein